MTISLCAYKGSDLAIIVPTKDRPGKMRRLLESIAIQEVRPGRLIIIDGGESIEDVAMAYGDRLPLEYYRCRPPGQIRQRNMGIAMVDESTPLVASFDDDIVLEPGSLNRMLQFWNGTDDKTAGVSFNIINGPRENRHLFKRIIGLSASEPGRVLRSGITTANTHVSKDLRAQWLCGGATVWRQSILKAFSHIEFQSRWAISEDLIFSYPVGKKFPLYVCSTARVRHEHDFDYVAIRKYRFHGYTQTIWLAYFVATNKDLSKTLFLYTLLMRMFGKLLIGLLTNSPDQIEFFMGQGKGLFDVVNRGFLLRKLKRLLSEAEYKMVI